MRLVPFVCSPLFVYWRLHAVCDQLPCGIYQRVIIKICRTLWRICYASLCRKLELERQMNDAVVTRRRFVGNSSGGNGIRSFFCPIALIAAIYFSSPPSVNQWVTRILGCSLTYCSYRTGVHPVFRPLSTGEISLERAPHTVVVEQLAMLGEIVETGRKRCLGHERWRRSYMSNTRFTTVVDSASTVYNARFSAPNDALSCSIGDAESWRNGMCAGLNNSPNVLLMCWLSINGGNRAELVKRQRYVNFHVTCEWQQCSFPVSSRFARHANLPALFRPPIGLRAAADAAAAIEQVR